jgi:GNAT superfamily N-acetyltransferase
MNTISIERYQRGQEVMIHQLIKKVYDEFVSIDCSEDGNKFFYDWIQPSKIAERQRNENNIWLAFANLLLAGMIEIRENKFISLLFVDKKYQRKGIAKKLFDESLKEIIRRNSTIEKFYVHASPYSIQVYKKMGFSETETIQEENGIKYLPMEMIIKEYTDETKSSKH